MGRVFIFIFIWSLTTLHWLPTPTSTFVVPILQFLQFLKLLENKKEEGKVHLKTHVPSGGGTIVNFFTSEPQTRAGPLLLLLPSVPPLRSPSRFLHQLQTSITQSFIKLECYLMPFLKTRSHYESAHTFGSSLRFLEVPPKRGFKKNIFLHFLTTFFYTFGLIGSVKTFSKVLGVGMNVGPYMTYILYI